MFRTEQEKLIFLRPCDISSSPDQARKDFDEYELSTLSNSIAQNGIINPLCVREGKGGRYILISGERRLIAAKTAGLKKIPCIVKHADDFTAAVYTVSDNMLKSDLSFFEQAQALQSLLLRSGLPQSELALRLGIGQSALCAKLRLLRLDETMRRRIENAGLSEKHARALLKLPNDLRRDALDKIIAGDLNITSAEALIENMLNPPQIPEPPVRKGGIKDIKLFENSLIKLLDKMTASGFNAESDITETEDIVEFNIRLTKAREYTQLKIC